MLVKMIRDEDYSSYREVSMLIAFPTCSFKCCTDLNRSVSMCQNSPIARLPSIDISANDIYERYQRNVITHSIVCGGLEPIDSLSDLASFPNIIVKYGRYIPAQTSHFDELLGVMLASPNQFAKKIS